MDNKLSIHFGDDKTKTIFFFRMKGLPKPSQPYEVYSLIQHDTVEYFRCHLDININRESMARRVFLKLIRQGNYENYSSRRLLCNAVIQPHFDYGC